jgi:hypothetical protein
MLTLFSAFEGWNTNKYVLFPTLTSVLSALFCEIALCEKSPILGGSFFRFQRPIPAIMACRFRLSKELSHPYQQETQDMG